MERYHAFTITVVKQTNLYPERVRVTSEYLGVFKVISYGDGSKADNAKDLAIDFLTKQGYKISGECPTKNGWVLLSTTFQNFF